MQKIVTPYHKSASSSAHRLSWMSDNRLHGWLRRLSGIVTPLLILGLWQFVTVSGLIDRFLVPPPAAVAAKFVDVLADGTLWFHTRTTMVEVLLGLAAGLFIGTSLGYAIARSRLLEELLTPVIVVFQSTPIVAYAPLLVIWFGSGMESKVVTSTLIVFFPMLMNTIVGIRSVPLELRDLMKVSQATWWQTFTRLELPAAMPVLLTGLKTSATLAVIGAVVGEFIVAKAGLGFWMNVARQQYDTPLVYVAVIVMALMAGMLFLAVSLLERYFLAWQRQNGL